MDTKQARELAAQYAGDYVPDIRAFALGARVSYESFVAQLDIVASEYGFDSFDDVESLRDYAGETLDAVWK